MKYENQYFEKFDFAPGQVRKHLENSMKDLAIAKKVDILDVKFNYAYSSFLKAGITLLSFHGARVKSVQGHQINIIHKLSQILDDTSIEDMGNVMRSKRNLDLYGGGIEITEKECRTYIKFVENVVNMVRRVIENS